MNFDVNYIVKENEGIVVCIISGCSCNAIELTDNYTGLHDVPMFMPPDKFLLNNQYRGIAKCNVNDTFDEEYGKRLAYRKAYLKYTTALEKKVKYITTDYMKLIDEMAVNLKKALDKVNERTTTATKMYNKVLEEAE